MERTKAVAWISSGLGIIASSAAFGFGYGKFEANNYCQKPAEQCAVLPRQRAAKYLVDSGLAFTAFYLIIEGTPAAVRLSNRIYNPTDKS